VKGIVSEVDSNKAVVQLEEGVEGFLRAQELARERVNDARRLLKEGDEIEAKVISVDRKKRIISLSIKALLSEEDEAAIQDYGSSQAEVSSATFGDLLKEQMENKE
jgi:small subunit ribosomal protein S1